MTHDALRELTGAYALGALRGEEKRALEAHLASCAECAAEVRGFRDVANGLGEAVPQIDPPTALRARVVAHVESMASGSAARHASHSGSTQRFSRAGWLALAASLVAAVLGFYALSLRDRVQVLRQELADARERAENAERVVQTIQIRVANLQRASEIVGASDVADIKMIGQGPGSAAYGRAFVSRSRGVAFMAQNLPPLEPGKTYQLWVVTKDKVAIPAGVFAPESTGSAAVTTTLQLPNAAAVAVTLEPAGGLPAPSGPFYLLGSI